MKNVQLTSATSKKIWRFLDSLYASKSKTEVIKCLLEESTRIIPHETAMYIPVDLVTGAPADKGYMGHNVSDVEAVNNAYSAHYYSKDPLKFLPLPSFANKAFYVSEVVSTPKLMDIEFYQDFLKPLGVARILACAIIDDGHSMCGFGFHRTLGQKDFGAKEKTILNLLIPHIKNAFTICDIRERLKSLERNDRDGIEEDFLQDSISFLKSIIITAKERYNLSGREVEIVSLLLRGAPNRLIAESLCLAIPTVKEHLGSIYKKAKASNRTALVAMLLTPRFLDS